MGWKDWNYRKRVSLIFLISDLILIIGMFPFYLKQTINTTSSAIFKLFLQIISYLGLAYPVTFMIFKQLFAWTGCAEKGQSCMKEAVFGTLGGIFIALIIYFFAGFFIGWIIDKFRKSKIEKLAIEPMQPAPAPKPVQAVQVVQPAPQQGVIMERVKKEEIVRKVQK